jgi:hypothetical protein
MRLAQTLFVVAPARVILLLQCLEELRDIVRKHSYLLFVKLRVLGSVVRIQFERSPLLDSKKFEAEEILHVSGQRLCILVSNRRLDHLEHAQLVVDHQPAGLLRGLTKFVSLARAPFRMQVARRDDGH